MSDKDERTLLQNRALHKFFAILSKELNSKRLDQKTVLDTDFFIDWTAKEVLENLYAPVESLVMCSSTTIDPNMMQTVVIRKLSKMLCDRLGVQRLPIPAISDDICECLAAGLNEAGFDQRVVLHPSKAIPWKPEYVKDRLWRPMQKQVIGKLSTTKADTSEYDKVYKPLMRNLSEKWGVYVAWPSLR